MFKIDVSPTYQYPVEIELLDEKGKTKKMGFKATFSRLGQADIEAIMQRIDSKDITDADIIHEVLVGWEGIQDEEGNHLEFSAGNRDAVCGIYPVQARIVEAWIGSLSGARRKN